MQTFPSHTRGRSLRLSQQPPTHLLQVCVSVLPTELPQRGRPLTELYRSALLFPPVSKWVPTILLLEKQHNFQAILIVPLWRNHRHIPLLLPDGRHFRREIVAYQRLTRLTDIQRGPLGHPGFLSEPLTGHKYMFMALLWRSKDWCDTSPPSRPPVSSFPHRFCLTRHYGKPCLDCNPPLSSDC